VTLLYVLAIIGAWAIIAAVFAGIGLLVVRTLGAGTGSPFVCFWLGWSATIVVLQVLHLFTPIDGAV
jgi:hypothetical protein